MRLYYSIFNLYKVGATVLPSKKRSYLMFYIGKNLVISRKVEFAGKLRNTRCDHLYVTANEVSNL